MEQYDLLNKIFTRNSLRRIVFDNDIGIYKRAIEKYIETDNNVSNEEIFKTLYKLLDSKHRNEYFYKNTLFNKLLLGKHSTNTSTALSELPVHKSKADFVLINKAAEVFEIKTSLDNLERLSLQLEDYYKAFSYITVVSSEENFYQTYQLLKGSPIGIKVLTKRNTLSTKKESEKNTAFLDKKIMFKLLRKSEFENIIKRTFLSLPEVSQFHYYDECFNLFNELPINLAQKEMEFELKERSNVNGSDLLYLVPYELRSLVYFSNYRIEEIQVLNEF